MLLFLQKIQWVNYVPYPQYSYSYILGCVLPLQEVALRQSLPSFSVLYYPRPYRSLLPQNVISPTTFWSSDWSYTLCLTLCASNSPFIRAMCPAHFHFVLVTYWTMSVTLVLFLMVVLRIPLFSLTWSILLSIARRFVSSFFTNAFVRDHVWHSYCCVSLMSIRKLIYNVLFCIHSRRWRICTSSQQTELNSQFQWRQKALRSHSLSLSLYIYIYTQTQERSGKGNNEKVPEQLDLESSFTFKICSDYACLNVSRETLRTIDSFLEQSRSI